MIEWSAVRNSANSVLPKRAAVAGWTHRALSFVEQDGVKPSSKDRGAEQGDVGGPLERSLARGMEAAKAQSHVAGQQVAGTVPWIGTNSREEWQSLANKMSKHLGAAPKRPAGWPRKTYGSG